MGSDFESPSHTSNNNQPISGIVEVPKRSRRGSGLSRERFPAMHDLAGGFVGLGFPEKPLYPLLYPPAITSLPIGAAAHPGQSVCGGGVGVHQEGFFFLCITGKSRLLNTF